MLTLLMVTICMAMVLMLILGNLFYRAYNRRLILDEIALHLEQDVDKSKQLLEDMIEESIVEWSLYNVKSQAESVIGIDRQRECLSWVIHNVYINSTPAIMDKIRIAYPANDTDTYIKSIEKVAKIHVLQYALKQNTADISNGNPNINISI